MLRACGIEASRARMSMPQGILDGEIRYLNSAYAPLTFARAWWMFSTGKGTEWYWKNSGLMFAIKNDPAFQDFFTEPTTIAVYEIHSVADIRIAGKAAGQVTQRTIPGYQLKIDFLWDLITFEATEMKEKSDLRRQSSEHLVMEKAEVPLFSGYYAFDIAPSTPSQRRKPTTKLSSLRLVVVPEATKDDDETYAYIQTTSLLTDAAGREIIEGDIEVANLSFAKLKARVDRGFGVEGGRIEFIDAEQKTKRITNDVTMHEAVNLLYKRISLVAGMEMRVTFQAT